MRVVHAADKVEDMQVFSDRLRFKMSILIPKIQTPPEPRNFGMEQQLKKGENRKNNIFDKRTLCLLEGKKSNEINVKEECCWAIIHAMWRACYGRSCSKV